MIELSHAVEPSDVAADRNVRAPPSMKQRPEQLVDFVVDGLDLSLGGRAGRVEGLAKAGWRWSSRANPCDRFPTCNLQLATFNVLHHRSRNSPELIGELAAGSVGSNMGIRLVGWLPVFYARTPRWTNKQLRTYSRPRRFRISSATPPRTSSVTVAGSGTAKAR